MSSNSCTPSKVSKVGAPSTFVPPKDAPKWAVDPTWKPKQSKLCMAIYRLIRKIVLLVATYHRLSLTVGPFTKHHHRVGYSVINISISETKWSWECFFLVASRKLM